MMLLAGAGDLGPFDAHRPDSCLVLRDLAAAGFC